MFNFFKLFLYFLDKNLEFLFQIFLTFFTKTKILLALYEMSNLENKINLKRAI